MYYLPAIREADAPYRYEVLDGIHFDWRGLLQAEDEVATEAEKEAKTDAVVNGFANWDALRAAAGRVIMGIGKENSRGKFGAPGICHGGKGKTGLFYDPTKNQFYCNK